MAGSDKKAEELKDLLTGEVENGELDELEKYLKKNFIMNIKTFQERLEDCATRIEKLDSFAALRNKIIEISNQQRKRFYIGYTNKLSHYLWTTTPKGKKWIEKIAEDKLVKRTTYYIHRDNNGDGDESDDGESDDYETDNDGDKDGDANDNPDNPDGGAVVKDETEAALISEFGKRNRCLNGKYHPGIKSNTGIIYVLKYEKI
ncbi:Signal peptidase complex subunit 2 [Desmophyllum pertusum]|uniref:Signal peptidase complex subunit 2 n=1 Tax=Desmophyllum pertusum TaxID=174260 RepID=A0A9X0D5H7_9CNID|nr:Signal peptidase complex subunit 2 [Desmophyllum pertusum]